MDQGGDASPVLLYDGVCAFCNGTVRFILRHDRQGSLCFAALRSTFAERVFDEHPELRGIDSIVWLDRAGDRVFTKSAAALRVAFYLGGFWLLALVLWAVPRPFRDWGYDLVARHRHLLAGESPSCMVPPPGASQRFLD